MMMAAPQRLQWMRTLRPRTFSSGTAYFAGQLPQLTFMMDAVCVGGAIRYFRALPRAPILRQTAPPVYLSGIPALST
jgi:hypothetical protein